MLLITLVARLLPRNPRREAHASQPGGRGRRRSLFRFGILNATMASMSTATLPPTTEAAIWARVINPNGQLTPPVARAILKLEFSADDQARMHELAEKAQEGELTPEEQFEIDNFERVGNMLAILKSQSRKLLKKCARRAS